MGERASVWETQDGACVRQSKYSDQRTANSDEHSADNVDNGDDGDNNADNAEDDDGDDAEELERKEKERKKIYLFVFF